MLSGFFGNHLEHQNYKQTKSLITTTITEIISITISNLAFWFIPQAIEYDTSIIFRMPSLEWYQILVILANTTSLASFIVLYYIEIRREMWLIHNFDYSRRYNSLHLTNYRREYPNLFNQLEIINRRYNWVYYITRLILFANISISTSVIIATNYYGYRTITTLITNFWICYSKISRGLQISRESLKHNLGIAYYNTQNLSFNRIDPARKHHISNSNLQNSIHNNQGSISNGGQNSRLHSRRSSQQSIPSVQNNSSNSNSPPNSAPYSLNNSLNNSFLGIGNTIKEIIDKEMLEQDFQCVDGVSRPVPKIYIESEYMEEKVL